MLPWLSLTRRRVTLVALAAAALMMALVVVVAVLASVRPSGRAEGRFEPIGRDIPGPVLLVPGYGGSTAGLEALAASLEARGRNATVLRLPGSGTGDMHVQARVLDVAADAAMQRTGASSVDVVGYSAGGVVARLWVREDGGAAVARRVVTLGSPHHGTSIAALAGDIVPDSCHQACRQLSPDSALLRELNAGDETPAGPRFVTIWTTTDRVVTPPRSAKLVGAVDVQVQSVCPRSRVEHAELPTDPAVQAMVLAELGTSRPVVPLSCERLAPRVRERAQVDAERLSSVTALPPSTTSTSPVR